MTAKRDRAYAAIANAVFVLLILAVSLGLIWSVEWRLIATAAILLLAVFMATAIAKGVNDGKER